MFNTANKNSSDMTSHGIATISLGIIVVKYLKGYPAKEGSEPRQNSESYKIWTHYI